MFYDILKYIIYLLHIKEISVMRSYSNFVYFYPQATKHDLCSKTVEQK